MKMLWVKTGERPCGFRAVERAVPLFPEVCVYPVPLWEVAFFSFLSFSYTCTPLFRPFLPEPIQVCLWDLFSFLTKLLTSKSTLSPIGNSLICLFNCSFSKMVKHKESQLGRNKVNASRFWKVFFCHVSTTNLCLCEIRWISNMVSLSSAIIILGIFWAGNISSFRHEITIHHLARLNLHSQSGQIQ